MFDESDETSYQPKTGRKLTTKPVLRWTSAKGSERKQVDAAMVIGSSAHCGIVLDDRAVSRIHAEVDPRDDGLWVRDLGSKNGTFCNGMRITGGLVPPQAILRLGDSEFRVEYEPSDGPLDVWPDARFGPLIGSSIAMRHMFAELDKVARSSAPVLIHGETGTGKEVVARAIHDHSDRAGRPFVVVDCGALSETLFDAELFGHTKGAFTGAIAERQGAFQAADSGTIFLDEIGEVPLAMQPKLLRVLESGTVRMVGDVAHRPIDVRVIGATHRDLLSMVTRGNFREDLYFRLSVLPIEVPALRSRTEDLPSLLTHFAKGNARVLSLGPEIMSLLRGYGWAGNVRELRNFAERVAVLGAGSAMAYLGFDGISAASDDFATSPSVPAPMVPSSPPLSLATLSTEALHELPYKAFRDRVTEESDRAYLASLMTRSARNMDAAARLAGLDKSYLYKLLRRHGM